MKSLFRNAARVAIALVVVLGAGCSKGEVASAAAPGPQTAGAVILDVHKSPTCGCCESWIEHVEADGFETVSHHPTDLDTLKLDNGITRNYQSCHTAISRDGYVFEGHVPARMIRQFLASPPKDALGLAVPGMPIGSPGMEIDDRFSSYQVLLLKADGSSEVFAEVKTAQDQY